MVFATYRNSNASKNKSFAIATAVGIWGIFMYIVCRYVQGSFHNPLAIPIFLTANLIWPTLLVFIFKSFFVGKGLDLRWLTGIQVFRSIGALFLLEHSLGNVGTVFAFAAGLGDIVVGITALALLIVQLSGGKLKPISYYQLITFGVIDFISAFTFGFLSSPIPFQAFAFHENHYVNVFPLGMIPFFLVPLAMAYHWLMFLTVKKMKE